MSSSLVTAHGGSKNILGARGQIIGGIITDTMANSPKALKEKHLNRLISETTGIPREKPIMDGILTSTVPSYMNKDVPELHKLGKGEKGKTQPRTMGQVPYAGPKY